MNKRLSYMVWQNMSDEEQQYYNALYDKLVDVTEKLDKLQGNQMIENLKNGMTVYFYSILTQERSRPFRAEYELLSMFYVIR